MRTRSWKKMVEEWKSQFNVNEDWALNLGYKLGQAWAWTQKSPSTTATMFQLGVTTEDEQRAPWPEELGTKTIRKKKEKKKETNETKVTFVSWK